MSLSKVEKVLKSIKLDPKTKKKLPKTWPACAYAEQAARRKKRDTKLYMRYLDMRVHKGMSDEDILPILADAFGYTSEKYVENLVQKMRDDPDRLPIELRSNANVMKMTEFLRTYDAKKDRVLEIDHQIDKLRDLRDGDESWLESEKTVEKSTRGDSVKTKQITIDVRLLALTAERDRAYRELYDWLNSIAPADRKIENLHKFEFKPDDEVLEMLRRNDKINQAVEADVEVIEE